MNLEKKVHRKNVHGKKSPLMEIRSTVKWSTRKKRPLGKMGHFDKIGNMVHVN